MPTTPINLQNLEAIFLFDLSGSMEIDQRYSQMCEVGLMLAEDISEIDQNGTIGFITFGGKVVDHGDLTYEALKEKFKELKLRGSTPLCQALTQALPRIKKFVTGPEAMHNLIVVVTDGEPDDKLRVAQAIKALAELTTNDDQLAIQFVQVGNDPGAKKFLEYLDDQMSSVCDGKDIVNTTHFSQISNLSLEDFVQMAFSD